MQDSYDNEDDDCDHVEPMYIASFRRFTPRDKDSHLSRLGGVDMQRL
jgi:hypothetical protein